MKPVYVYREKLASLPDRKTTEAAAYDLCAFLPCKGDEIYVDPLETVIVPTGLYAALPPGSAALVCSRSGHAVSGMFVTNGPGIIDSDYRGEIKVILTYVAPLGKPPLIIQHGMRVAQLLFLPAGMVGHPEFIAAFTQEALPEANSTRMGGFGSTGA